MACVQSALTLLIGFALLRGAAIGGLSLVSQQVVNLWFVRRRGIAAAAASLGLAAGSMVFPQLIDFLISLFGWRGLSCTCRTCRADHSAGCRPAIRDRPEKFGLGPDAGLALTAEDPRPEPSFSRQRALRTGVFWLLCAAGFLTNAVGTALLLNHFSIMQTAGVAYVDALTLLALAGGVQAVATLGTGFLVDRYEPRRLVPLAMGLLALASALPAFGGGVAASWFYALSLGGAYGSQQAINAAGYAQYFGRDHLGAIRGTSFVFGVAGAALGPLPFAASIDWTESYAAVLTVCCALSLMCGAAAFIVSCPAATGRRDDESVSDDGANVMTGGETTVVAGIEIPSTDPVFLTVIFGLHIPLGLACVGIGAIANVERKASRPSFEVGNDLFLVSCWHCLRRRRSCR
jgi:MFS family permease